MLLSIGVRLFCGDHYDVTGESLRGFLDGIGCASFQPSLLLDAIWRDAVCGFLAHSFPINDIDDGVVRRHRKQRPQAIPGVGNDVLCGIAVGSGLGSESDVA